MAKNIDLVGKRFGKMSVLYKVDKKGKNSYWHCKCDCGVEKDVCYTALKRGQQSCGCSAYDFAKDKVIKNKYTVDENNIVHVELRTGEEMLCDLEDWNNFKDYTWTKDAWGYASASMNRKRRKFHTVILEEKQGFVIDHIDRNKLNNLKSNLRYLTKAGNAINSKISKNNTSGEKGITRNKRSGKWIAQIMVNGKHIHLGTYKTIEEAIEARKKAEEKYFEPILKIE